MKQIDIDELPPKIAAILARLGAGEALLLVRGGAVIARLALVEEVPPYDQGAGELPPEEGMKEVLEQFSAMINDEF